MTERIDFHAHVLPGADHGSDSVETSLRQLALAEEAGVSRLVATPHFYPDRQEAQAAAFFDRRRKAYAALQAAYGGAIQILIGAEVFLCQGLQHHPRLSELCVEGTDTLLIELPAPAWSGRERDTLSALLEAGYRVVLAHIERYPYQELLPLLALGCRAQLNAGCLASLLRRRRYLQLVDQNIVWALGSDIHGSDQREYRQYAAAWAALGEARGRKLAKSMANLLPSRAAIAT